MSKTGTVVGIIVVLVIIGAVVLFYNNGASKGGYTTQGYTTQGYTTQSYSGSSGKTPVMMTDPAKVPSGTQAVVITYTSLMVHTTNGYGGWVNANGSGTVNLLAIQNSSQLIGYANVSANTTINLVRFAITSAYITINGTARNLTVPNNQVTVAVTGSQKLNSSTAVLVDLSPVVTATYNQNTTSYTMAPAAKAVVVSNAGVSTNANVGAKVSLNANASTTLSAAPPTITITSVSLSAHGNVTRLSFTVKNNAATSVTLTNVYVYGQQSVSATSSANASLAGSVNGILNGGGTARMRI